MIWPLLNKIFGWDYVAWSNSAASGVARVHRDYTGVTYYWRYKITGLSDEIKDPRQVLWLTCSPDKYIATPSTGE